MPVGKVRLLGENFLKGRDGGLKLLLVDVALGFVKQIVERIGKLLRFGLAGWLCFCGSLRPGCRRIILINRGIPSQSLGIKLNPYREINGQSAKKRECGISSEGQRRHGSAGVLLPFAMVAEPPLSSDAPLGGRFA